MFKNSEKAQEPSFQVSFPIKYNQINSYLQQKSYISVQIFIFCSILTESVFILDVL